jgi:hypothetical protein
MKAYPMSETSQERTDTVAEHSEGASHTGAVRMLTTQQGQILDVVHGVPKGATHEETTGATEDQFGDQQLATGYHSQLRTWITDDG